MTPNELTLQLMDARMEKEVTLVRFDRTTDGQPPTVVIYNDNTAGELSDRVRTFTRCASFGVAGTIRYREVRHMTVTNVKLVTIDEVRRGFEDAALDACLTGSESWRTHGQGDD